VPLTPLTYREIHHPQLAQLPGGRARSPVSAAGDRDGARAMDPLSALHCTFETVIPSGTWNTTDPVTVSPCATWIVPLLKLVYPRASAL
jgi:hypothetical protein